MSVLVPSFPSSTNSHHHYFPNRRINGTSSQLTKHMSLMNHLPSKLNENNIGDIDSDHVPFGVVNSMKQRLLDKVNESLLLNNNFIPARHSLSKSSSSRLSSNENLLQVKPPLNHTTRLSRSQENLLNHNTEQFTSYLQPKQDVIIIDTTVSNDENISIHRHSYTELHIDEVPKPGTVTTVKNMFERQIRLSRYDSDKPSHTSIPTNSRMNSQHREALSPSRSRSISPNDMALRQRRTAPIPPSILSTTLSLPVPTSYPDLVISHTPPPLSHVETNKSIDEQFERNAFDESTAIVANHIRSSLLLPSTSSFAIVDYQPLDFKSRLALFSRTNTKDRLNENSHTLTNSKKPLNHPSSNPPPPNFLTKPVVHRHPEKKDIPFDQITRPVVNTAKAITFFGGTKVNGNTKSSLPASIAPPPPPPITKDEQPSNFCAPNVIGGNVKLNKSSIFSGAKKDIRVQFIENVDTFEYPSFNVVMTEFSSTDSDDDDETNTKKNQINENVNDQTDDVGDDELEQLALINTTLNSNNLTEKPLESKGTLHTFRPTHLDQYELGTQHGSLINSNLSDKFSSENFSSNHSISKPEKSTFDMTNNIQWSSMSITTDLLF